MGVFLVPMAGVTDLPFRILAREYGADLVVSEMITRPWSMPTEPSICLPVELERPTAIQIRT